ncbi:MAG: hypothetical protein PHN69_07845 [Candidatus Pacebacteria bacterium]|nr:hypothetical protein [Candidatus Paceibacterota bacterium]
MTSPNLSSAEQNMANTILRQMGLSESDRYKDDIDYELNRDYETNESYYNNLNVVDKPEFIKKEEYHKELKRRGTLVNGTGLNPLKDMLIVKMYPDREPVNKFGIIIADVRAIKQDNPKCNVVALNESTEYDFKVGDDVLIDTKRIAHRYFHDGFTHLVLKKDGVLAIYE